MVSLRTIRTLLFATLLMVVTPVLAAPAAVATPGRVAVTIAKARSLPLGTVVTVNGAVTTPSGVFESSFFDKGFGLQDRSAGIYISLAGDLKVKPGREVHVTGTLRDSFGLLIVVPTAESDVSLGHAGFEPTPKWVATAGVGESTEGRLVRVLGKISQAPTSDLPFGYKFWVTDGSGEVQVFVNVQTGIDVAGLALGQRVLVTGFSGQFDTSYEILPRSPHDIRTI
jgi:hypothetical protein